jgi:hypothetical protein
VDSLGDSGPPEFEHHVVTNVGEDFCLGAVGTCGGVHFMWGDAAVALGAQYQEWRAHPAWFGQVEKHHVQHPPPDIELPMHGAAFFEAANEEVSAATATVYGISGAVNLGVGTVHIAAKSLAPTNQPAAASS